MKVGEIEVLPVFDGFGYEPARDVLLKPGETDPWARHEERLDAHGRLEFTLGGFLVRTGDRTILVDAGAGTIDTSAEIPELVIGHVANPAANPLGVRGVGEGGTLGPAAALAGAVGDALGVAVDQLPITPSGLWELTQQQKLPR